MENNKILIHITDNHGEFNINDSVISFSKNSKNRYIICLVEDFLEKDARFFSGRMTEKNRYKIPIEAQNTDTYYKHDFSKFSELEITIPNGYRELKNHYVKILKDDLFFRPDIKAFAFCKRSVGHPASKFFKDGAIIITKRSIDEENSELNLLNLEENRLVDIPHSGSMRDFIAICAQDMYTNKGFSLNEDFDWEIKKDERGFLFLLPLKKKISNLNLVEQL